MIEHSPHKFCMPRETWIGIDSIEKLGSSLKDKNIRKCLLVTDEFMDKSEVGQRVKEILEGSNIDTSVYNKVKPNPTMEEVYEGVSNFLKGECDAIVSLGGGSPHDCAKGIKYSILKGKINNITQIPFAAINTTAGTASEITRFAVITDSQKHAKITIVDDDLIPDIAIDDPVLMLKMPKSLTAATGMDALTHALEAYVAKGRNYITDSSALEAVRLIDKYLLRAYNDGSDIEARDGMVYAQYMAGMAFSNSGLGIIHAMAHQLGGLYNLPHGVCNAVLLPYGIGYNLNNGCLEYGNIAKAIDICEASIPSKLAGDRLIEYIHRLNSSIGIPRNLSSFGVKYEDISELANMTMADLSLKKNPVEANVEDVKRIFEKAYNGI